MGAILPALFVSACAVGPRYLAPSTPSAAAAPFVSTGPAGQDEVLPARWWRLYKDPVLDDLIQKALAENQSLKIAGANLAYAQALLNEARAGRYPATNLTAGPQYGRSATGLLAGAPAAWAYSAGFTATYQVDLFGRIRRTIEQASANLDATRAAEDVVRVTVAAATAEAYANICGLGEQIDVARRSIKNAQDAYDIDVRQRDAGGLSDFDVSRQNVLLQQALALEPSLEGQRRSALFAIAALIGKPPTGVPASVIACAAPPRLDHPLPVGDGAALIRRRPDIRQAERMVAANTAGIGVAMANLYPTVTLGGSVASGAGQIGQMFQSANTTYNAGPLISWTFPNIVVARAQVAEARAQATASVAAFHETVLQALQETEQALANLDGELKHNRSLAAARTSAEDALHLVRLQYQAGSASGLDLLSAEASEIAADQALAVSDQAVAADQVAVFQALGGGWEEAPSVSESSP